MSDAIRKLAEQITGAACTGDSCGTCSTGAEYCETLEENVRILTAALSPLVEAALLGLRAKVETWREKLRKKRDALPDCLIREAYAEQVVTLDVVLTYINNETGAAPGMVQMLVEAADALLSEMFGESMVTPTKDDGYDLSAYGRLRAAVDAFKEVR